MILLMLAYFVALSAGSLVWLRRNRKARRRFIIAPIGILGIIGFFTVLYGAFVEPQIIVTTHHSVAFPARQPLTIAVISDLHVGPFKGKRFVERVVKKVNATKPDLVFIPGDFLYTSEAKLEDLAPLGNIHASFGIYAVIGNHDLGNIGENGGTRYKNASDAIEKYLADMHIITLRGTSAIVHMPGGDIAIAGMDDPLFRNYELTQTLASVPKDMPLILLSHSPDIILNDQSKRAQLIVTGHTHGGQIRLPFMGPLAKIPDRLGRQYDQGIFTIDADTTLAITRGVGESGVRARLFAWPEVMILDTHP